MAKKTKEEQIGRYNQKERDKKAGENKAKMRAELTRRDVLAQKKIAELEAYKSKLNPKEAGYSSNVYQIDQKIAELKEFRKDLAVWYKDFNAQMSLMRGDDVLTDGFLDKAFMAYIQPDLKPESKPGLQISSYVDPAKIKQYKKGEKHLAVLAELEKGTSEGEAPPKAKPTPKPESKTQTTQTTQTAPTPPEPDPEDVSLAQVLDETEAKIPD